MSTQRSGSPLRVKRQIPVIHLVDSFGLGGCQSCLRELLKVAPLNRRHFSISLRAVSPATDIHGPFVIKHRSQSRLSLLPLFTARRLLRATGPAIVHCHLFRAQAFGFLLKLFNPSIQLVFHERGRIYGREHEPLWEAVLFALLIRISRRYVDMYVANSARTLEKMKQVGLDGRVPPMVIYNSILSKIERPSAEQRKTARIRFSIPENAFVFGFAGRIVGRKGWRDFLALAERFAGSAEIYWMVAGEGSEWPDAHRAALASSNPRVRLVGHIREMDEFYSAIDCCVVPSHWEPHGLVQIEAHGRGIPVIASDVPGMSETMEDGVNALIYPAGDVDALYQRATLLVDSPQTRAKLSSSGLCNAERFSIQHYSARLEEAYRQLLSLQL
jgi:glycosyltransferase involved in cell wall biosynthesis